MSAQDSQAKEMVYEIDRNATIVEAQDGEVEESRQRELRRMSAFIMSRMAYRKCRPARAMYAR